MVLGHTLTQFSAALVLRASIVPAQKADLKTRSLDIMKDEFLTAMRKSFKHP